MKKNQFTNFDYEIITSSSTGKKEVKVSYEFDGKQCRKYLPVNEEASLKDSECIEAAKAQIEADIKSGQLAKYSKKFTFSVHFGVVPTVIASIAGVAAITCASLFAWKAVTSGGGGDEPGPTPSGETEIVEFFNEDGSLIKREKVTKGDKVTKPEDPETDDGYFTNWYTEPTFEHIYNFNADVEKDLKLYPKFAKHLLRLSYGYTTATTIGEIETPTIEIAIDADPQEEVFINWGDSEDLIPITDFSKHITHTYIEEPASSDYYNINVYGKPDAVSLSCVTDEAKPWETHLFRDDNSYFTGVELYQDLGDASKSSSFGGINSNNEKASLNGFLIHDGVTFIPNHFFASSTFNIQWMLISKGVLADSVETIGEYAFANTELTQALIRDCVKYVKKGAFQKCTNLNYVRAGRYLKSIGDNVFDGCSSDGLNFYADDLYFEYDRTKECPASFGASAFGSFTKFYFSANVSSSDDFIAKLTLGGWPIGGGEQSKKVSLSIECHTQLLCKHSYKLSNTRYPLVEAQNGPNYYYDSPFIPEGNAGWLSEIKCIDDPTIEISSNVLSCSVNPFTLGLTTYFYKDLQFGEETCLAILKNDLQQPREFLVGFSIMFLEKTPQ